MKLVALTFLLGFAVLGQETQTEPLTKEEQAAAVRFYNEIASGKEFAVVKLDPLVKLGPDEMRCGDYFVKSVGTVKSTGQKIAMLFYWIEAGKDYSSMEFKRDKHVPHIDDTNKAPKIAMRTNKDGKTSEIMVRISAKDLSAARPCLPPPEQATAKK